MSCVPFSYPAINRKTTDQTTTWTFGTTLDDSDIASSLLLRSIAYPDSEGGSDAIFYSYNRQGQKTTQTDQRGCLHEFDYDLLGRQIHDRVTILADGVDDAVLRLSTEYEVRGMATKLTSWDNATVGLGNAVNECQFVYNKFAQLVADFQEHSGAVDPDTTPVVQYGYEDGSANTIRKTTLTYPNGRVLAYNYGTTGEINDAISRIQSLIDDDLTHLADYSFVGVRTFAIVEYAEPGVEFLLADLSGANDPDTGDIYSGLDRFGRVKDCRWYNYGTSIDVARLKYGYDRVSNRLWRADLVAQSFDKDFDELYAYDGLHRLKDMQRGLLDMTQTSISDENFAQCWTLDSTNNWAGFREADPAGSWTTVQSRTANTVNEITDITATIGPTTVTPDYDLSGNMTLIPTSAEPADSYTATYDAWNRLVRLYATATSEIVQQNQYDPRTFRIFRVVHNGGSGPEFRHFYYTTRWQSIEQRLGTVPNERTPDIQYIHGIRYIDEPVLRDRDTSGDGILTERLYALQDANWNVVALVDATALDVERTCYSAFGTAIFLDSAFARRDESRFAWHLLYCGYTLDSNTLLYYVRTRYLSDIIAWTQRDRATNSRDLYSYDARWVLTSTDPFGLMFTRCTCACVSPAWGEIYYPSQVLAVTVAEDDCRSYCESFGCQMDSVSDPGAEMNRILAFCNQNTCPSCDQRQCERMLARAIAAAAIASETTAWIRGSAIFGNLLSRIFGAENYCHTWGITFEREMDSNIADEYRACVHLLGYQPTLNASVNSLTGNWTDHHIHILHNTCTGKCLLIDNGPFGGFVDPCNARNVRGYLDADGLETWNGILSRCGCPQ